MFLHKVNVPTEFGLVGWLLACFLVNLYLSSACFILLLLYKRIHTKGQTILQTHNDHNLLNTADKIKMENDSGVRSPQN